MNENNNSTLVTLIATGLLTALTIVATMFLKIPVGMGYIHMGDAVVFLSVLILPLPYAVFVGALGTSLADLFSGYSAWAPWSLFIMALSVILMRLILGKGAGNKKSSSTKPPKSILGIPVRELIAYMLAIICVVAGYYVAEVYLYGSSIAAITSIPFNLLQAGVGVVCAYLLSKILYKTPVGSYFTYKR